MSNETQSQNEREREAEDRLIDWGLRANAESGAADNQPAPDLTERILRAAKSEGSVTRASTPRPRRADSMTSFFALVVTASLVVGITGYWAYLSSSSQKVSIAEVKSTRQSTPRVAELDSDFAVAASSSGVALNAEEFLSSKDEGVQIVSSFAEPTTAPFSFFVTGDGNEAKQRVTSRVAQNLEYFDAPRYEESLASSLEGQVQREKLFASVEFQGKDVTLVTTPETRTRTEWYTTKVPVTRFHEQRFREVPYFVHVPKLIDASGDEIEVTEQQLAELQQLIKKEMGQGQGPELGGDKYTRIDENPFVIAKGTDAVSTFSIDVDTASYSNVRQYLVNGQLPPPDAVRIEELVNYFEYGYVGPDGGEARSGETEQPFATHAEVAQCPWNKEHRLVRIGIKGKEIARDKRPLSNLVFLVDVSGSMRDPNKLELVVDGLSYMTQELGENDRVAIVVYAGSEGLALPATRGDKHDVILAALKKLTAGGSTAGGAGIKLAYKVAEEHFIEGGTNRVILCTDGDFNVGISSTADLERLAEQKAKDTGVFLTALGFGRGNLNDEMMEAISNCGNGTYHYIDNLREARRVLVQQLSGTLVTIAKDVKIQVEFNPANVAGYRLLGYENRMLNRRDFNDDTKDAGEVGAGHTVTALYEVIPAGVVVDSIKDDPLKYQAREEVEESEELAPEFTDELLTLRLRYKQPDEDKSTKIEFPVKDASAKFRSATEDFRFAAAVAGFGMLLRDSQYKGNATFSMVRDMAAAAMGQDERGYRAEFLDLVDRASQLK